MNRKSARGRPYAVVILLLLTAISCGKKETDNREIHIAVASNFSVAARAIAQRFENETGYKTVLLFGSTGKHYAQIINGARIDVFLAADSERPRRLVEEGLATSNSRFTYAEGRLVLWSPDANFVDNDGAVLNSDQFRFLAIANPRLAPYGRAAKEVLENLGLWSESSPHIVRGENVGQAFQFIKSGNAELGFIASSQIDIPGEKREGSLWEPPDSLYSPIEQQVVLLSEDEAARAFLDFLKLPETQSIIREHGYRVL